MTSSRSISIPTLVRIKTGALDRCGIYLSRVPCRRVALLSSEGLPECLMGRVRDSLEREGIARVLDQSIRSSNLEEADQVARQISREADAIVGVGGGKALDSAKYIGAQLQIPYFSVPTSLSNDGFCSPQSSLCREGRRYTQPAAMPYGVILDTEVCLHSPKPLWLSGVGDLVSKITAIRDWKLAFHHDGTPVDDFAALLSDATVFQFMGRPEHDLEGMRLLATALMLNGVAMAVCGSSRPASGSEHLISHALDATSSRPRLHGLQVGMATYLISHLHGFGTESIRKVFDQTGFWHHIQSDPFNREEWRVAIQRASSIKPNFHTILSRKDYTEELMARIDADPILRDCFVV